MASESDAEAVCLDLATPGARPRQVECKDAIEWLEKRITVAKFVEGVAGEDDAPALVANGYGFERLLEDGAGEFACSHDALLPLLLPEVGHDHAQRARAEFLEAAHRHEYRQVLAVIVAQLQFRLGGRLLRPREQAVEGRAL